MIICSFQISKATVINLEAPVSNSITPSILYYSFDFTVTNAYTIPNLATTGNTYYATMAAGGFTQPTLSSNSMTNFGQAVNLLGGAKSAGTVSNPKVNIPNGGSLNFASTSFTLGTWIQLNEVLPTNESQRIIIFDKGGLGFTGADSGGFTFFVDRVTDTANIWQLKLETRAGQGNGSGTVISSIANFGAMDEWLHLGLSYNAVTKDVVFWLNGSMLSNVSGIATNIANSTRGSVIGERQTTSYSSVFNGQMDDFFITSDVHTFIIPEPSVAAILFFASGIAILRMRHRRRS